MKIKDCVPIHKVGNGKRVFLTIWSLIFDHKGREGTYYMVARGENLVSHQEKKPDAVVVVATLDYTDSDGKTETKLVLTSEFRIPLRTREIGFPAGLIDDNDYSNNASLREAAIKAAVRELKEETNLDLEVTDVSPPNLYSSAGMTNESITYVFGKAYGTPSQEHLEPSEDIETILATRSDVEAMLYSEGDFAHSKTAWPFLWAFAKNAL